MSYVDDVLELVVAKNPAQPEFHRQLRKYWNLYVL